MVLKNSLVTFSGWFNKNCCDYFSATLHFDDIYGILLDKTLSFMLNQIQVQVFDAPIRHLIFYLLETLIKFLAISVTLAESKSWQLITSS